MKLALAQINARLGDLDGICSRIERQLGIARDAGADLLCLPAPLMCGVVPGSLVESGDFEHDMLKGLERVAQAAGDLGIACLVPAVLALESGQLFEVFLLRKGRVIPLRLTMVRHSESPPVSPWSPPVFEVAGTRIAVTFDAARDMGAVPPGCDLVIYFPVNGFDMTDPRTAAVASVRDGGYSDEVSRAGVWFACMEPVGGYDEAVYPGGSFVMDDGGRVVAQAPCFEEALLVQDVRRGMMVDAVEMHELPAYRWEQWLWETLGMHLRDAVEAHGGGRVVVPLRGDLPSSLLAVLAVDALGPRNVFGLLVGHEDASTSAAEAVEAERASLARQVAGALHVRLLERTAPSALLLGDRDAPVRDAGPARLAAECLILDDTARDVRAMPLAPLTKTDYALRANALAGLQPGVLAPFGDVYLSALEWLAKGHAHASAALPAALLGLAAVEQAGEEVIRDAVSALRVEDELADRAKGVLGAVGMAQLDAALEAHVDRNAGVDDLPIFAASPEAAALLVMLVRQNELGRRMLPPAPIVSARGFAERAWPMQLAWSDMGLRGEARRSAADLAEAEFERMELRGSKRSERARDELMGMLGEMLGLAPEQQAELFGDEARTRMGEELRDASGEIAELLRHLAEASRRDSDGGPAAPVAGPGFGLFSLN